LFFPEPIFGLILLNTVIILYVISRVKLDIILKRAKFLLYFGIFIFLIQLLFTSGDIVIIHLIPLTSPVFPGALTVTTAGVSLGLSMTLRFLVIVLSSFWFISITDPNRLASSLMQVGLPYRYGFMLVTALRFLPQFEIESNTVRNAQLTRGIRLQKHGIKNIYNHVKFTLRPLIFSALQKAETLARSMEGRGFGLYKTRTFVDKAELTKGDLMAISIILSTTISLVILLTFFYDLETIALLVI
jgi:energy-coupling factor transport system permease protein